MPEINLIIKENKLIEAKGTLTLNEQKMILYAINKIDKNQKDLNKATINAREFADLLEVSSADKYAEVKAIAESLNSKSIEIKKPNGGWLITSWLSSFEYITNTEEFELEFSNKLLPYLTNLVDTIDNEEITAKLKDMH